MRNKTILGLCIFFGLTSFVQADSSPFFSVLPDDSQYQLRVSLNRVLPVYIEATENLLYKIEELGLDDSASLKEVPREYYSEGAAALSEVIDEEAFASGRRDHDVRWLKNSLEYLERTLAVVRAIGREPGAIIEIDKYLVNTGYYIGEDSSEISLGIGAVSRFYCNLEFSINSRGDDKWVSVIEVCD